MRKAPRFCAVTLQLCTPGLGQAARAQAEMCAGCWAWASQVTAASSLPVSSLQGSRGLCNTRESDPNTLQTPRGHPSWALRPHQAPLRPTPPPGSLPGWLCPSCGPPISRASHCPNVPVLECPSPQGLSPCLLSNVPLSELLAIEIAILSPPLTPPQHHLFLSSPSKHASPSKIPLGFISLPVSRACWDSWGSQQVKPGGWL